MGLQDRTLEEVLDEGVARLGGKSTWKLWTWAPDNEEALFFEAEAFRTFVLVRGRRGRGGAGEGGGGRRRPSAPRRGRYGGAAFVLTRM